MTDRSLIRPAYAVADAKLLQDALVGRYQVPADQVLMLTDESRARLEQSIPEYLGRIAPEGKLLVFFSGHAYKDSDGKVYLALKDFDPGADQRHRLGVAVAGRRVGEVPRQGKASVVGRRSRRHGRRSTLEPSAEEMLGSLKAPPGRGPLRTVTAIASCKAGQHSLDWPEKQHGLFALARGRRAIRAQPTRTGTIASNRPSCSAICKTPCRRRASN